MDFLELAAKRFSVRSFSDKPVEDDKINMIIEAGRVAPTACNFQPHKIYVVKSPEAMAKLTSIRPLFNAPLALIVCYNKDICWKNSRNNNHSSGEVDAAIVATHLLLEATELGIGSCWVGSFNPEEVSGTFGIPENEVPETILAMGYPAPECKPSEKHSERKSADEISVKM